MLPIYIPRVGTVIRGTGLYVALEAIISDSSKNLEQDMASSELVPSAESFT